ncbi:hypothetical protein [Nonomuraea sp. B19D2]|uniref:hypothetical protein n=1 Tax=Nonomuraea sp. B19D2 TaxID=3159561 RepID=UPI0032DAC198
MSRKMTGPEHARAALDFLAEAKKLVEAADKDSKPDWRAAFAAQASACADIAAAELQAAQLALQVVAAPMAGLDPRQAKEWRDITGVM